MELANHTNNLSVKNPLATVSQRQGVRRFFSEFQPSLLVAFFISRRFIMATRECLNRCCNWMGNEIICPKCKGPTSWDEELTYDAQDDEDDLDEDGDEKPSYNEDDRHEIGNPDLL